MQCCEKGGNSQSRGVRGNWGEVQTKPIRKGIEGIFPFLKRYAECTICKTSEKIHRSSSLEVPQDNEMFRL
jgi:hypothetical protein